MEVMNEKEVDLKNPTFEKIVDRWFKNYARQRYAGKTLDNYQYAFKPILFDRVEVGGSNPVGIINVIKTPYYQAFTQRLRRRGFVVRVRIRVILNTPRRTNRKRDDNMRKRRNFR